MNIKIWAYLGIIVAVLGGLKWAHSTVYKAGWNAAIVEQERLIADAKDEARNQEREFWEAVVAAAEDNVIVEEKIVEVIKEVERKIPVVVDRIVEVNPACNDLGDDFAGLLNEQIRASADREGGDPDAPAEPDS